MTGAQEWKPRITALLYAIQFIDDPLDGVDHVLEVVVSARALDSTPEQYLSSVREALASQEQLSKLLPQSHSEEAIRRFLSELASRLEGES